jgi:hypothetical protein
MIWFLFLCATSVWAKESSSDGAFFEKKILVESGKKKLQITNTRGDLFIRGWERPYIRLKIYKKGFLTEKTLESLGVKVEERKNIIEIREWMQVPWNIAENPVVGKESFFKVRTMAPKDQFQVDMMMDAPAWMQLDVWSKNSVVSIQSWKNTLSLRSNQGSVFVDELVGAHLDIVCMGCNSTLRNIKADVSCVGKDAQFDLRFVSASSIFVETETGKIKLAHMEGDQVYSSLRGGIEGRFLTGKIQYQVDTASVDLRQIRGSLGGKSEKGSVFAQVAHWAPQSEVVFLESVQGDVTLEFPAFFSSYLDVWSFLGSARLGFEISSQSQWMKTFGPEPMNHLKGRVGDGEGLLKVYSERGKILITKNP